MGNIHIEIDCRKSDFKYLKEQFIESLSPYFDLYNINWNNVYKHTFESSILIEICNYYNKTKESPSKIGIIFNVNKTTVRKYLKTGNKLNICNYTPFKNQYY